MVRWDYLSLDPGPLDGMRPLWQALSAAAYAFHLQAILGRPSKPKLILLKLTGSSGSESSWTCSRVVTLFYQAQSRVCA